MNEDRMCLCPKCGTWFYVNRKNSGPECPDCQCFLICTNISSEEFDSMPEEKRAALRNNNYKQEPAKPKKETSDSSIWMRIVEIVNAIIISVSILFGILIRTYSRNTALGIVGLILSIFVGLIIASGSMMFVDIARDIRAIRNKMDA